MFKKLNIDFSELDFAKVKGDNIFKASSFSQYSILDTEYIFDILNKRIQFGVAPEVNVTEIAYPGATPHTDNWQTAINFYFDTGTDETAFWKKTETLTDSKKGLVFYNKATLKKISSFIANKGDCYLLDVGNSIHSVEMHIPDTTRKILRLYWRDLSFNEVLNSLKFL